MFNSCFIEKKEMTVEMKNTIADIKQKIKNKIIPLSYPDYLIKNWSIYDERGIFIQQMGFVLLSLDWIIPLAKWIGNKKCLEIMAGTGSLSYALKQQDVNIIATDNFSWDAQNSWNKIKNYWTEIENIDAIEAIKRYGKDVDIIIMSWAYMDDVAYKALLTMREVNPDCIMLVIGEECDGCTADDDFFENIVEIEDKTFDNAVQNFKQWRGLYDYPYLVK